MLNKLLIIEFNYWYNIMLILNINPIMYKNLLN